MKPKISSFKNYTQLEGRNVVLEALRSQRQIYKIYLLKDSQKDERLEAIAGLARKKHVSLQKVERKMLDKIAKNAVHQGVIAKVEVRSTISLTECLKSLEQEKTPPFFILLTEITYEQNLGAILRSAEASGVTGVIVPNRSFGLTPVVERVAMGAAEYVSVVQESLFPALKKLRQEDIKIIGADARGEKDYSQTDLTGPICFVIGGEDKGLTEPFWKNCDQVVKIPLKGKINSLNMSVSAALLLFEKLRQEK